MPAAAALYYSRGLAHAGLAGSFSPSATRHVIHMDFEASLSIALNGTDFRATSWCLVIHAEAFLSAHLK